MNIIFFGTSSFGIPALEKLNAAHTVTAVVSTPDKPAGRRLQHHASPVKKWALERQAFYLDYSRQDPEPLLSELRKLRPDLLVVVSFGAILPSGFLMLPRLYALNIHASLLPKYRGAAPMQYALLNGDPETGVSILRMIERLDAGDILLQKKTAVGPSENLRELEKRLSLLGAEAVLEAVETIEKGNARFTVQNESQASYAKKISKGDGKIDWTMDAGRIHDRIRAFYPWPGSYFFMDGKRLLVLRSETVPPGAPEARPGTVLQGAAVLEVACGHGTRLRLTELQLEGKKALSWKEFSKGRTIAPGSVLE